MTRQVVTVAQDLPIMEVIHILQERHLIRVPVVKDGLLVGIVARQDILFGYVKATSFYWP
ncbi:MAG: CBS domain-containing protein [Nitrospiraceae bacterium]